MQYALAKAIGVPARRINEIVHGKRAITADTAAQTWMNLQTQYDTELAREQLADVLRTIEPHVAHA